MNTTPIHYSNLEALSKSDYILTNGGTDITGWQVVNESEQTIGRVQDLLFDTINNTIRYLVIELLTEITGSEKTVILPIGLANLSENTDAVVLPDIHQEQFSAMPRYISGEVTHDMEDHIRSIIGSPVALRLEEDITELDRSDFYKHHHFDRGNVARDIQSHSGSTFRLPPDSSESPG